MQSARTRCRAVWPLLLLVLGLAGIPAQTPGGEPGPINPQPIGSDRTTNPLVNEQGQNPYLRDGFCALPLPETDPDPVNLATGAFTFSQRDLQFAGIAGNDLVVARFHDSGALYDGPFGKQWDSPIFRRVFDWGPGTEAHVLNGELRDDVYAYGGSSGGVTSYQTPPGFYFQLVKATVGSTVEFRLADARGTVQTFEFNATIGGKDWYRLKETRDAHGNRLVFSYDAVRRLVAIGDTLGGTTTISYWPTGAKANRVRTITDPTGAATSYDYDSAGRLVRVRLPATPANPVADFVYGYDASGRLASVTEPGKSEPYLVNAYDGAGRLTSQQFGAPGQVSTVDYQSFPWVSIVDRGGALTECLVDPATHKILQKRQHLATPSSTVLVTTYTYDAAGHRVREVRPNGQVLEWDYDVANPDPRSRDNVLEYRRKASLADPLPLVTRWTWVPGSSRIATVMTPEALVQSGGIFDASRAIRFTYGPTGLLLSAQMPEVVTGAGTQSAATSFGYDALGRMITRIDADGLLSVFEYDPNVLRPHASVVRRDPNGLNETTSYEFDAANDVVRRLAACGCAGSAETRYVYDARRNLVEVRERIDAATERVASFAYDACGNLVQRRLQDDAEFGDGFATTTWSYDLLNNATHRVQDADASTTLVTAYGYDSKGRLARVDGPEGYARTFQYDERDLVVEERHVGSPATTADDIVSTFVYDGVGRLVDFTDPLGRHRTFSWDGYDRVLSDSDAASSVAFLGWDADGNLRSYRVEGPGNVVLDERNFDFDARHRLRRVDRRHVDAAGNAVGDGWLTVEYEHDPVGRVVAQRLESGTTATWSYDILGRTVSVRDGLVPPSGVDYEYFPDGFLKKVTVVEGNQLTGQVGTRIAAEFVAYDGLGRPLVVRDAAGRDTVREWGLADRVRAMIDRRGYRQEFGFDELGRKRREIRRMVLGGAPDPKDLVTTFDYDGLSRIIAVHAENGPTTATQTTAYAWDSQSRLTRITAADVSFETFTHDAAGNLVRYVDANGTVKTFSYDALDRLLGIDIQRASGVLGETFATFQRDALGRIVQAENDGYRVYRTWTSLGGLDTELVQEKNGTFTGTVRVLYGILGRVARVVYPAHTAAVPDYLDFVRDGIGRLISLDKREGAVTRRVLDFSYAGSRVVRRSSPTRTTDIGYDLLGEVNLVDHRVPSRPVARFEITRDAHGLVSDVLRTHYGPTGAPLPFGNQDGGAHYDYDGAERLTRSWSGLSAANLWAGNLGSAPLVKSYALDRNFNRTQVATAVAGSPLVRENYLVDLVNEYLRVGLKNVDYDDVGNTRTIQPGPGFAYDHAGRLVRITDGAATIDLGLDPFGRRLRTDLSATGTTERLSYLGWQPIEQRTTTGATTTRIEFHPTDTLDDVVEIRDATAGTVWQVFADQWGSPVALVGPGGQTAEMYRYDDFGLRRRVDPATGAALSGGAAALSPIGFQGRFTIGGDERWMDFRHRLYLPEWGRFASPDPLGYPDDLYNRYHFVGHNPNSKDPFGLNEDGHPADSPIAMTHVGETKAAAKGKLTDEDAWRVGYENWNQDNSPAVAGLGDADNAPNHAIGDEKTRRHWLEEHLTSITTDCSFENLGRVLHFVQDYVYHRDEHGNPYTNETWGHAKDSASGYFPGGFDPDNPPPPYDKMRNAESIAVSKIVIDLWLSWCGNQDAGGNYQPDYSQGGRPKDTPPPGPTTGGGKGPTTPGSSGPGAPGGAPGGTPSGPHTGPHTGNPGTPGGPGGAPGNGPGPTTGGPTTPKAPVPTPGPATGPATGPKTPGPATGPTTPGGGNGGPRTGPTTPGSAKAKILSELEKNTPKKPKKPKK